MNRKDFRPNDEYSSSIPEQKSGKDKDKKWERIAGGYERNSKTGIVRATDKYGSFGKAHDEAVKRQKEQDEKRHYEKLDKKREKKRNLLIDKPHYEEYTGEDLRVYKINGKLYYRDTRLKEYRNIDNPQDKQDINIDNSKLQIPNKSDKKKLMEHDKNLGKNFPENHEIYYKSRMTKNMKRAEKKTIIDDMQKYPDYAVPSRKYLYTLDISKLKEEQKRLHDIFKGRKLVRR